MSRFVGNVDTSRKQGTTVSSSAIPVLLAPHEIDMAAHIGVSVQKAAIKRDPQNVTNERWGTTIEQFMVEMAFAKVAGIFWDPGVLKTVMDRTLRIQLCPGDNLSIPADAEDNDYFILATGKAGQYAFHGYVSGKKAKTGIPDEKSGAYQISPEMLKPLAPLFRVMIDDISKRHGPPT